MQDLLATLRQYEMQNFQAAKRQSGEYLMLTFGILAIASHFRKRLSYV